MGFIQNITKATLKDAILYHSKSEKDTPMQDRMDKIKNTQLVISIKDELSEPSYFLFYNNKAQRRLSIHDVITDKFDIYGKKEHTPNQLKKILINLSNQFSQELEKTKLLIEPNSVSANAKEIKKLTVLLLNGGNVVKELTFDDILPNM